MNKRHRIRSREIKAIMNADKWDLLAYKDAKRRWKKGIRAFPVGLNTEWVMTDLSFLNLSQQRMDELGWAVRHLIHEAKERNMTLEILSDYNIKAFKLYFRSNPMILRNQFGYRRAVSTYELRQWPSLITFAGYILEDLDHGISKLSVDTAAKIEIPMISIPCDPLALKPIEPIFGDLIERR